MFNRQSKQGATVTRGSLMDALGQQINESVVGLNESRWLYPATTWHLGHTDGGLVLEPMVHVRGWNLHNGCGSSKSTPVMKVLVTQNKQLEGRILVMCAKH